MPCPRHGSLGIFSVQLGTLHSSGPPGTCGFSRVYRSPRPRAKDIEPASADCSSFASRSPPLSWHLRMVIADFTSCLISLKKLMLCKTVRWHTRGWFGIRKHRAPIFSGRSIAGCVVWGKPGSRVMPEGWFAELNSEVERAEARRVRRSRSGRTRSSGGTR